MNKLTSRPQRLIVLVSASFLLLSAFLLQEGNALWSWSMLLGLILAVAATMYKKD